MNPSVGIFCISQVSKSVYHWVVSNCRISFSCWIQNILFYIFYCTYYGCTGSVVAHRLSTHFLQNFPFDKCSTWRFFKICRLTLCLPLDIMFSQSQNSNSWWFQIPEIPGCFLLDGRFWVTFNIHSIWLALCPSNSPTLRIFYNFIHLLYIQMV